MATRTGWLLVLLSCRPSPTPATIGATASVATVVRQPIAAGVSHSCARSSDGHVSCWGDNAWGELGAPGGERRRPTALTAISEAEGVAVGFWSGCAWTTHGEVWCWGRGQDDTKPVLPTKLALDHAAEVQLDVNTACVRRLDRSVACWSPVAQPQHIVEVPNTRGDQLVMAGGTACVRAGVEVTCWTLDDAPPAPRKLAGIRATAIALGDDKLYGLRTDHEVVVSSPETGLELAPPVAAPRDPRAIVSGTSLVCTIGATVACWDTNRPTRAFVEVPTLAGATDVAVGNTHACARTASGELACWGSAELLGDGRAYEVPPTPVPGLRDVAQIVVASDTTCIRRTTGTVACWGRRIGDGVKSWDAYLDRPTEIAGIDDAVDLSLSSDSGCARLRNGEVACWSNPTPGPAHVERVAMFAGATRLLLAQDYRCAIVRARVVCDRGAFASLPLDVREVWPASDRICDQERDGHVRCTRQGRLPDDLGTVDVATVGFGLVDTCVISKQGGISCRWLPEPPVEVTGLPAPAVAVARASDKDCALLRDGRVACWKEPDNAAGPRVASVLPGISDAVELAGNWLYGCVRHASGTVSCWGVHRFVGDGLGGDVTTPVVVPLRL